MTPQLVLEYQSADRGNAAGIGWDVPVPRIERQSKFGVTFGATAFAYSGASSSGELIEIADGTYRSKFESDFNRYEKLTNGDGSIAGWRVTDRTGTQFRFGLASSARWADPGDPSKVYRWLLERIDDRDGNRIDYVYDRSADGMPYLTSIAYVAFEENGMQVLSADRFVAFEWQQRPDTIATYPGFPAKITQRLHAIQTSAQGRAILRYELSYDVSPSTGASLLSRVDRIGADGLRLPPLSFEYTVDGRTLAAGRPAFQWGNGEPARYRRADFNGDGRTDVVHLGTEGNNYVLWSDAQQFAAGPTFRFGNGDPLRYAYSDFTGDGMADILHIGSEGNQYLAESTWAGFRTVGTLRWGNGDPTRYRYFDFDGDGKTDIDHLGTEGNHYIAFGAGSGFVAGVTFQWGNGDPARYRYGDFNGDGRADIIYIAPDGKNSIALSSGRGFIGGPPFPYGNGDPNRNVYADINGDGLSDFIHIGSEGNQYLALSTGSGVGTSSLINIGNGDPARYTYADFNGDGTADILYIAPGGSAAVVLLSRAAAGSVQNWGTMGNGDPARYAFADFDGDGRTDAVHLGSEGNQYMVTPTGAVPDLLHIIRTPLGGVTELGFAPSTAFSNLSIPFAFQVLTSVGEFDGHVRLYGRDAAATTQISYTGGYYHIAQREFRGFAAATVTSPPAASGHRSRVTIAFHQGDGVIGEKLADTIGSLRGKVATETLADETGRTWLQQSHDYLPDADPPFFRPAIRERAVRTNDDGSQVEMMRELQYDEYGNVITTTFSSGRPNELHVDRVRRWRFDVNVSDWLLAFPTDLSTFADTESTKPLSRTTLFYDSPASSPCATSGTPTRGHIRCTVNWLDGGDSPAVEFTYDKYGNVVSIRNARGFTSYKAYDASGTFPVNIVNAADHVIHIAYNGGALPTEFFGTVKSVTDPSGNVARYEYDSLSRLRRTSLPDGSWTSYEFQDVGMPERQRAVTSHASGLRTVVSFDGIGDSYETRTSGPRSTWIVTRTERDQQRLVTRRSLPYIEGESLQWTAYRRDVLGRVTEIGYADGSRALRCYQDWNILDIDQKGHGRRKNYDAYDQLRGVDELKGKATCTDGQQSSRSTRYDYDAIGRLKVITDAHGNRISCDYDTLGRRTVISDPDMGTWINAYDSAGNLVRQTDPSKATSFMQYDALNRLVQKDFRHVKAAGRGDVEYAYDDSLPNGIGRISTLRSKDSQARYLYDSVGRTAREYSSIDGRLFVIQRQYDSAGRVSQIGYPDGTFTYYEYDGPFLSEVRGVDRRYATFRGHNAIGAPAEIGFGNGTRAEYTYDPATFRKTETRWRNESGEILFDEKLDYDRVGNVISVRSETATTEFEYDEFDRLVRSSADGIWQYDDIGNITSTPTSRDYRYESARPHAVTSVGGESYRYDARGNVAAGGGRTVRYSVDNLPSVIASHSRLASDGKRIPAARTELRWSGDRILVGANGNVLRWWNPLSVLRWWLHIPDSRTTYVAGGLYQCRGRRCQRNVFAAGRLLMTEVVDKRHPREFIHADRLGSTRVVSSAEGKEVARLSYAPFGQQEDESGTEKRAVHYRFTGQRYDAATGLYVLGTRLYDPQLARFLQPDNVISARTDPQTLNRYSYVRNNPTNLVDPTGHREEPIGGWDDVDDTGDTGADGGGDDPGGNPDIGPSIGDQPGPIDRPMKERVGHDRADHESPAGRTSIRIEHPKESEAPKDSPVREPHDRPDRESSAKSDHSDHAPSGPEYIAFEFSVARNFGLLGAKNVDLSAGFGTSGGSVSVSFGEFVVGVASVSQQGTLSVGVGLKTPTIAGLPIDAGVSLTSAVDSPHLFEITGTVNVGPWEASVTATEGRDLPFAYGELERHITNWMFSGGAGY